MPTSITTAHHFRPACRGDQYVRAPAQIGHAPRAGMGDGHGGIGREQKRRHGTAHDAGPPQHHGTGARQGHVRMGQQPHHRARRARRQHRLPVGQPPDVQRVEAVHIAGRVDRPDHRARIDLRWQG
jgi:hypothetical protein